MIYRIGFIQRILANHAINYLSLFNWFNLKILKCSINILKENPIPKQQFVFLRDKIGRN